MKPPLKAGNCNDFQTPKEAIFPLLTYLKKDWVIWECACGTGNLVDAFTDLNYTVFGKKLEIKK